MIVAGGLTSAPNTPKFPGEEIFEGTVLHQQDLGPSSGLSSPEVKQVAVLAGAISAADMVCTSVKAGKSVSWIIRASGTGPGFFNPVISEDEITSTRMTATMTAKLLYWSLLDKVLAWDEAGNLACG